MAIAEIDRTGTTDITEINGVAEQQFFLLLKQKLPSDTQIIYEDRFFAQQNNDGKEKGTIPDFHIIKPDGKEFFIEITTQSLRNNGDDPKKKQKEIMNETFPVKKYTVLYREHLENIQKHNPEFSFLNGKKIRKKEQQLTLEFTY